MHNALKSNDDKEFGSLKPLKLKYRSVDSPVWRIGSPPKKNYVPILQFVEILKIGEKYS